jgi:hypothetical protein
VEDDEVEPGDPVMMVMIVVTTTELWVLSEEDGAIADVVLEEVALDWDAENDDDRA